ncbi:MAG: hypothetical protein LBN96_09405 [Desulfovibrio sp.]|nr:hypothetical protein [Desulfovibrio sp.]
MGWNSTKGNVLTVANVVLPAGAGYEWQITEKFAYEYEFDHKIHAHN